MLPIVVAIHGFGASRGHAANPPIISGGGGSGSVSGLGTAAYSNSTAFAAISNGVVTNLTQWQTAPVTNKSINGNYAYVYADNTLAFNVPGIAGPVVFGANGINIVAGGGINANGIITSAGTTTADSAATGNVGEFLSTNRLVASGQALATAAATNVCALPVGAGDWDVEGNINFNGNGATNLVGYIGTTSAALVADASEVYLVGNGIPLSANVTNTIVIPRRRFTFSSTTTFFLVGKATFGGGTVSTFGTITARRAR